jgi:hypothetical protein
MVKQFIKNEEEDLSDFEVNNQEDMGEMEVNIINVEEALLNHQKIIREDFHKIMKTKDVPRIKTMDLVSDSVVQRI